MVVYEYMKWVLQIITMSYIEVKQMDPENIELEVKQIPSERCQLVTAMLCTIVVITLIF